MPLVRSSSILSRVGTAYRMIGDVLLYYSTHAIKVKMYWFISAERLQFFLLLHYDNFIDFIARYSQLNLTYTSNIKNLWCLSTRHVCH